MPSKTPISWIIVLVAVAGIVAAIILTSPRGPLIAPSSEEDAGETVNPRDETFGSMLRVGPNAIYVDTQTAGASSVLVGIAAMEKPGYVVIHADDGGVPGRIIGTSELRSEGGEQFEVSLSEALVDGQVYYAMLHTDDGDGSFDAAKDAPVTDMDGNVILMSFEARTGYQPSTGPSAM
jgi:hypothetical protein